MENEQGWYYLHRNGDLIYKRELADFVDLQESPAGFGDACLEAMAGLCKDLGYMPTKMWGKSFADILKEGGDDDGKIS